MSRQKDGTRRQVDSKNIFNRKGQTSFFFSLSAPAMKYIGYFSLETTGLSMLFGPCHRIAARRWSFNLQIVRHAFRRRQRESGKFSCDCGKRELQDKGTSCLLAVINCCIAKHLDYLARPLLTDR